MTDDANIHGVESAAMMRPTFLYPKMLVGYKFISYLCGVIIKTKRYA